MKFTKEQLIQSNDHFEYKLNWDAVVKITSNKTHYFIYNAAASAVTTPKNALNGQKEDIETFLKSQISFGLEESKELH